MTLKEKQVLFAKLFYRHLIPKIYEHGYDTVIGFGLRCKDCKVGHEKSNHKICLAVDVELFYKGEYVNDKPSAYEVFKPFGEFWEELNPLCKWGGRFDDANHFSLEHEGMK